MSIPASVKPIHEETNNSVTDQASTETSFGQGIDAVDAIGDSFGNTDSLEQEVCCCTLQGYREKFDVDHVVDEGKQVEDDCNDVEGDDGDGDDDDSDGDDSDGDDGDGDGDGDDDGDGDVLVVVLVVVVVVSDDVDVADSDTVGRNDRDIHNGNDDDEDEDDDD